ncbi:tyrosine-type recombinase/integrase [Bradyrhizobium commune]|uniref:Integrase arm-type DNA-binding domain-containing protein n=1 Tax=Bradyrhizobium commune TaxID=83627 RepID=A0A7S9GYN9_9BRAD|nr:integrase arm-type DNA-binding domain-containing protein [Bradyrhizobium commune]QPF90658.1 integrase arm-type DNA-binding domain-containing protein [Bradyrhizobium commune]
MAVSSITIRAVQALKPGETIWDADHREAVRGFGVRRQREQATYVLKYRVFGRQRFVTIGPHGAPWTPEKARREAKRLLGLVADGKDPQAGKKEARDQAADTLGKVVDGYLAHAKKRQRPKTYSETERYLLVVWKPLHSVSIFAIRRRDMTAQLAEIEAERGAVSAARARSKLSALFNWAIREGYEIEANPVSGTHRPEAPKSRKRTLTDDEIRDVWAGLDTAPDLPECYPRYVRSLLLCAARRNEGASMHSTEFEGDLRTIPGERYKTKLDHVIPLTDAVKALIGGKPHGANGNSWFVFSTTFGAKAFSGFSKAKRALNTEIARRREAEEREPMPNWTLHDLRRTARSLMSRAKVPADHAERCLGHVIGGVRETYDRYEYLDEKREAFAALAGLVNRIVRITGND